MTVVDPTNPIVKRRRAIHDALSETIASTDEGHILSGWVLLFETCGPDGERSMHTISGDAVGELDLTPWTAEGWTRYVAASGFFDADEEEDE